MEFHRAGPYRWNVAGLSRLEGDRFERDVQARMHVHLRTDLNASFWSATILMNVPTMSESEFDEWAERFLQENERGVLKHLARLFQSPDEPAPRE